ncbi:hypothetical protein QCA50_013145 [Cerrena zonata]|uniref:DUF6534 domain-containing protein n=1 Tax=Cerrena zonata TaxID=2478898 RepID=A0AAW0G034_9APHY
MIVDGFYIYRMWTLSRNTILVVAAIQIFLGRNVTFLYWIAQKHDTFSSTAGSLDDSRSTHDTLLITTCLAVGLDIIMAATMVYYLQQNKPEIQRSRGMINWLVIYYVNTGAILASLSIATLVVAHYPVTFPSNLFMGLQNIFAKVMANSFFGVLNSRQLLRAKMETPVVVGPNVFGFVRRSSSFGSIPVRIEISKETTEMVDDV